MSKNAVIDALYNRRSKRNFTGKAISDPDIELILDSGRWAPSGRNTQPWKFITVKSVQKLKELSDCTAYSRIITGADTCIAVLYDSDAGYDRDKDMMGIGACIENMLLAAHSIGIGGVWLGEILKDKNRLRSVLGISENYEPAAVIAFGYSDEDPHSSRKDLNDLIINTI